MLETNTNAAIGTALGFFQQLYRLLPSTEERRESLERLLQEAAEKAVPLSQLYAALSPTVVSAIKKDYEILTGGLRTTEESLVAQQEEVATQRQSLAEQQEKIAAELQSVKAKLAGFRSIEALTSEQQTGSQQQL